MYVYTKDLNEPCNDADCSAQATKELFNTFNASMGRFCAKHARQKVAKLKKIK